MSWFRTKREYQENEHKESRVEVQALKKATKKAVTGVKKASEDFNQKFDNNHFTLTIWLAAGGTASQNLITKVPGENKKTWKRIK